MKKAKKAELDTIPLLLEKTTGLINREIDLLMEKESLTADDSRMIIAYCQLLSTIYKDYRAEIKAIELDLKGRSKADILNIIKADGTK